ncbi:MAG: PAS domain S-box protein, partial [Spirochaetes bacterium]|nr:PAS domain S-box protein [Spirochaetota bacterium]
MTSGLYSCINHMKRDVGGSILLVEDEAIIALGEQRMLERNGFAVELAHSGEDAVRRATADETIELILMDIDLGHGCMDGTEAARRILACRDLPIVFLSSHTEPDIVRRTEEISSYGYVVKDSGETVLTASIRMAFRLYHAHQDVRARTEAVEASERKYRMLFEAMKEGLAIYRAMEGGDDFELVDLNRAGLAIGGTTRGEVIGRRITEVFPGVREIGLLEVLRAVYRDSSPRQHPAVRYQDGSIALWVENYVFKLPSGLIVALFEDTTEQRASEESYRTIVHTSMDGFWVADRRSRICDVNDAYVKMSGYTREQLLGMHITELEARETAVETAEHMCRVLDTGKDRFKSMHRRKDGTTFAVEVTATASGAGPKRHVVAFIRDSSERRGNDETLQCSETLFQAAVRHTSIVFAQADRDLRYTWIANVHEDFEQAVVGKRDDELADNPGVRELMA